MTTEATIEQGQVTVESVGYDGIEYRGFTGRKCRCGMAAYWEYVDWPNAPIWFCRVSKERIDCCGSWNARSVA